VASLLEGGQNMLNTV